MKTLKEIKNMKKKKGNTTMKKYIAILMAIACAAALLLTGFVLKFFRNSFHIS